MVSSVAACCARPSYGARPAMHCQWGWLGSFLFFLSLMTFTFDLWPWPSNWGEIFVQCTEMPSFIVVRLVVRKLSCGKQTNTLTNTLTNKQTPLKTSTSLRYNTPVGNNWLLLHYCFARVQRVAAWFVQSCWFATHTHAAWVSQQHEYELQVNMIEVTKQWLFELWQSSNAAVISCYQLLFLFYSIDYTIYGVMQHGSINLVANWVKFWAVCWGHSWGEKKLTFSRCSSWAVCAHHALACCVAERQNCHPQRAC